MKSTTFTVDAALLRELGERLIGRSYIALAELVKNSYDADATNCRIEFGAGEIAVTDNGHGMSEREFLDYWMRIGTTHKTEHETSRHLGRAMTGSKGLGRLSVQFLADEMTLESTSIEDPSRYLYALVDWTEIQHGSDLDTVNVLWEMRAGKRKYAGGRGSGTRIILKTLRSDWDVNDIGRLGKDVWMLQPPYERPQEFPDGTAQDFYIDIDAPEIERATEALNRFRSALFSNWKARIRGSLVDGRSEPSGNNSATVSAEFKAGYPKKVKTSSFFSESVRLPVDPKDSGVSVIDRAEFDILIFKPAGRQPEGLSVQDMRAYLRDFGNVSIYDGGFRLPYYGASQDWLNIAVDQGRRLTTSTLLPANLQTGERYLLDLPAPGRIFGLVKIDTRHERRAAEEKRAGPGACLQISPGRDRLADNAAFDQLRDLVRLALDFYANRYCRLRVQAAEDARSKTEAPSIAYGRAIEVLDGYRVDIPQAAYRDIRREIVTARDTAAAEEEATDVRSEMLAPLATAGMTALALNHELAREMSLLEQARHSVRSVATRTETAELNSIVGDLDAAAERISVLRDLFDPLLSGQDRQATERLLVVRVVRQVVRAFEPLMTRVSFDLAGIPAPLRFPVGSLAEWSALLQNLLTNAWNAMLDAETASVSFEGGRGPRGREWLRISDTGVGLGVPLHESEALFEPFERRLFISDENRSIAMGGQGLGLAIVRMIGKRRSVRAGFVDPKPGFATTIEISWKGAPA